MKQYKQFFPDRECSRTVYDPGWRYRRAKKLAAVTSKPNATSRSLEESRASEGVSVTEMAKYIRQASGSQSQQGDQVQVEPKHFGLHLAMQILNEPMHRILELKLRLLAVQPYTFIANQMSLDPEAIKVFSIYHFDVRDKNHRTRFLNRLLEPRKKDLSSAASTPITESGMAIFENFLFLASYRCGEKAIRDSVDAYIHFGQSHDLSTQTGLTREKVELGFYEYVNPNLLVTEQGDRNQPHRSTPMRTNKYGAGFGSTLEYWMSSVFLCLANPAQQTVEEVDRVTLNDAANNSVGFSEPEQIQEQRH